MDPSRSARGQSGDGFLSVAFDSTFVIFPWQFVLTLLCESLKLQHNPRVSRSYLQKLRKWCRKANTIPRKTRTTKPISCREDLDHTSGRLCTNSRCFCKRSEETGMIFFDEVPGGGFGQSMCSPSPPKVFFGGFHHQRSSK